MGERSLSHPNGSGSPQGRGASGVGPDAEAALSARGHDTSAPARGTVAPAALTDLLSTTSKDLHMTREQPVSRRSIAARAGDAARLAGSLAVLAVFGTLAGSAAPAFAAECPNEQLRIENNSTRLPECRAYEIVSAPYKEGFAPVSSVASGGKFTDDGTFAYLSLGNFAGDGMGATQGNNYIATRTPTGWVSTSPNPSGPAFQSNLGGALAFSADLGSSVWEMRLPGESSEIEYLYVRRLDGSFTRVGPLTDPATTPPGTPGTVNQIGGFPLVSEDLSHIVFGDSEYVGTGNEWPPKRVTVDNAGEDIGGCPVDISNDGRVVFFIRGCGTSQLWARLGASTSVEASASECTRTAGDPGGVCNGPGEVLFSGAASDGSRVFFTTTQQLVNGDTDQTGDLYACDIPSGTPAPVGLANPCVSLDEISGAGSKAEVENAVRVSADGSRVYFVARGVLAANTDALGEPAVAGDNNLYVSQIDAEHPAGQTTFVAKLAVNDLETNSAQATADGRYLVFSTANRLLPSDTDEERDVYRYDADTHQLLRLSTDTSGTGGNSPGFEFLPTTAIDADASTVIWQTSEALAAADTNGQPDIYAWHDGRVSLISSGRPYLENPTANYAAITPSGTDIFFTTTAQLTAADGDTNSDIYDARIEGGFTFASPPRCDGEGCQGTITATPAAPAAAASSTFDGPAGVPPTDSPPANPSEPRPLTRAQKLAKALKACSSKHNRKKRTACQKHARRTYGRSS